MYPQGYASLVNPGAEEVDDSFSLDRALGLPVDQLGAEWFISSPLPASLEGLATTVHSGDTLSLTLHPGEICVLHFNQGKATDWAASLKLQEMAAAR